MRWAYFEAIQGRVRLSVGRKRYNSLVSFVRLGIGLYLLFSHPRALSQSFVQEFNPFVVIQAGDTLSNPFSGGIDIPQHQFADIDGDSDFDLFLLDRDGRLTFYRNDGSITNPRFILVSIGFQGVQAGSWFRFVDIDADGDLDLFSEAQSSTVNMYRNNGSRFLANFSLEIAGVKDTSGSLILSESISVPAFADLDGDGDLDFFSGNSVGSIWYYENVGTPSGFRFRFVTDRYQNIIIIGTVAKSSGIQRIQHGAMAIAFADIDSDGDKDLFWGDFFNRSMYYLQNQGTATNPQLVLIDSTFADEAVVQSTGFNMPSILDIDGDGRFDMFIGVLTGSSSTGNFLYYRNAGTAASHQFQLQTTDFLRSVDVGSASSPAFADIDNDGDLDLMIGSEDGRLALYDRQGTPAGPIFRFVTSSFIALPGLFNVSPALGDIDGNGTLEMMVGDANGKVRLYRNSASWSEDTTFQLRSVSFGQNASPAIVDIDIDGRKDLFVGTGGGRLSYYHNDGTSSTPNFVLRTGFFLSVDVGDDAKPVFVDLDNDMDFDLIIGDRDGRLSYWRNDGNASSPLFSAVPNFFLGVTAVIRSAPAFCDVDGDGRLDLFLGNMKGGLYYYEHRRSIVIAPETFLLQQNFPNPFNSGTMIRYDVAEKSRVTLKVYNLLGEEIQSLVDETQPAASYQVFFEARGLASGVYFCRMVAGERIQVRKLIVLR